MKRLFTLVFSLCFTILLNAQNTATSDFFRNIGKIYVVVAVIGIVFLGMVFFLVILDRRLAKLEQQIKERSEA